MTKHLKLAGMLFLSFFLCVGNYAQAERRTASTSTEQQTGTCTGVVKDAKGETLPGASVVVKNAIGSSATPIGTTTGMDGDFTINNITFQSISGVIIFFHENRKFYVAPMIGNKF